MNNTDYKDHTMNKQNKEYFTHLVRVAIADENISSKEMELLHHIGKRLGYTSIETNELIENTGKHDYIPPYELSERFEQVYEIVKMTLADGVIDKNEMRLASSFATKSGFSEDEIPKLLAHLISGIREGIQEDDLYDSYRKRWKS